MKEIRKQKYCIGWITTDGKRLTKSVVGLPPGVQEASAAQLSNIAERWVDEEKAKQNYKRALRKGKVIKVD